MATAKLSSNWKKLQADLKSRPSTPSANPKLKIAPSNTNSLKRKASTAINYQAKHIGAFSTNKRPKLAKPTSTFAKPSPLSSTHQMGAYISTLPGASLRAPPSIPSSTIATTANRIPIEKTPLPLTKGTSSTRKEPLVKTSSAGKYLALDCEMVGTHSLTPFSILASNSRNNPTPGPPEYSILARVSLVSYALETVYDAYVLPPKGVQIVDYRTQYSGITPWHLNPSNPTTSPKTFETAQQEIATLLTNRILVGHALKHDLAVLGLSHPRIAIRDTAQYKPFRERSAVPGRDGKPGKARTPSLKKLAKEVLGVDIQGDERKGHSSAEDARAAMELFKSEKAGFEREVVRMFGRGGVVGKGAKGSGGPQKGKGKVQVAAVNEPAEDEDVEDEVGDEEDEDEQDREDAELLADSEDNEPAQSKQEAPPKRKNKPKKRTKRA